MVTVKSERMKQIDDKMKAKETTVETGKTLFILTLI